MRTLTLISTVLLLLCTKPHSFADDQRALLLLAPVPAETLKGDWLDLTRFVQRRLADNKRFQPVILSPTDPVIARALEEKKISASDLLNSVPPAKAHQIAAAIGVDFVLRVACVRSKEGIASECVLDSRSSSTAWKTLLTHKSEPFKPKDRKDEILGGINANADAIAARLGAEIELPVPAAPSKPEPKPQTKPEPKPKPADPPQNSTEPKPKPADAQPPKRDPTRPSAAQVLVARFRRSGDLANLITSLRMAITDRPYDAELRMELIEAYRARGWHDTARREAERAVQVTPNSARLHRLLGQACLESNEPEKAIELFRKAVAIDPADIDSQVALGDALWAAGQAQQAQDAYAAAVQNNPKRGAPYRRLALLQFRKGAFAEAARNMNTAVALHLEVEDGYMADYTQLFTMIESDITLALRRLTGFRREIQDGARTREAVFNDIDAMKKRSQSTADFLNELVAPSGAGRIQALFAQCALMLNQACEASLTYLETKNDADDRQASLLKIEAAKQLADAMKRLKALTPPKPAAGG
jgi:tetratricopeptide (TPR) repeat protein